MASSQQIMEIGIYQLKEGVNLENVGSDNTDLAILDFVQSTKIVKAQRGFIRQFWGHEVEHPHLFVWSIDWNSFEHHTAFIDSEEYNLFTASLSQIFDLKAAAPTKLYTYVTDTEAATAAFRSGVTEVAFFTMPTRPDKETRTAIEKGSATTLRDVQEIGKATGAAIGWVFDAEPHALVSGADSVSLYGVFGYASVDVHMKWRETSEGTAAREEGDTSTRPATIVPGIDPYTGYFHVKFHEGI